MPTANRYHVVVTTDPDNRKLGSKAFRSGDEAKQFAEASGKKGLNADLHTFPQPSRRFRAKKKTEPEAEKPQA